MENKDNEKEDDIINKEKKIDGKKIDEDNWKKEEKEEICENKIVDKKQILQDKLKKIFLEREKNKYKYNKINIPDNLKYSSDNKNSISSIDNKNKNE